MAVLIYSSHRPDPLFRGDGQMRIQRDGFTGFRIWIRPMDSAGMTTPEWGSASPARGRPQPSLPQLNLGLIDVRLNGRFELAHLHHLLQLRLEFFD